MSITKRKVHLDFLRIFAIFFVVYTHVGFNCEETFMPLGTPIAAGLSYLLGVFCRVAVPLFFMISGALLLPRNEGYRTLFKKRIFRMAVVLLVISAVFYMLTWEKRSIIGFFKTIYADKAATSLWYIYSYIELLLILPLLRKLAQNMSKKDYLYLFILKLVFTTLLPVFETLMGSTGSVNLNIIFLTTNVFYFLMGHFFENVATESFYSKKNLAIINILGAVSLIIGCVYLALFFTNDAGVTEGNIDTPLFTFIAIPTFAIYFDGKYIFSRVNVSQKREKFLSTVGGATFGVYLTQGLTIVYTDFVSDFLCKYLPMGISGIVYSLLIVTVCTLVIIPIRKIPVVNKFI